MAKIESTLFNEIRGKLKHLEFRVRKNGTIELSMKRIPSYTRTAAQDAIRTKYGRLVQEWKQLTESERAYYENLGRRYAISGWNAYVMKNMSVTAVQPITLEGFDYYRYINIPVTTQASEEAQYYVLINGDTIEVYNSQGSLKTSGTGGSDFWSNVKSDGSDIRVFDQSQNLLYFFVESFDYTNQQAKMWIRLTTTATEINIAYGNNLATTSSYNNPNQVFEEFNALDSTSGWTKTGGTLSTTTTSKDGTAIQFSVSGAGWYSAYLQLATTRSSGKWVAEFWMRAESVTYHIYFGFVTNSGDIIDNGIDIAISAQQNGIIYYDGSAFNTVVSGYQTATWYLTKLIIDLDAKTYDIKVYDESGNLLGSATGAPTQNAVMGYFGIRTKSATAMADVLKIMKPTDPASFGTPTTVILK